jgi:hypothetical protein
MPAQTQNSAAKAREADAARRRAAAQRGASQRATANRSNAAAVMSSRSEVVATVPAAVTTAAYTAPEPIATKVIEPSSANKARAAAELRRKAAQRQAAQPARRSRPAVTLAPATVTATRPAVVTTVAEEMVTTVVAVAAESPEAEIELRPLDQNSVRAQNRNRRQAMAKQGKAMAPRRPTQRVGSRHQRAAVGTHGREAARMHRVQAARGQRPEAATTAPRPTGRIRPQRVPAKVEIDETLKGNVVSGTQVNRPGAITGVESGSCRVVTGTEYLGADHFDTICGVRPEANKPKVGISTTVSGMVVSGTEVGRSGKVTGDESGSCRTVTGVEYLGQEQFATFCENKGINVRPPKVVSGTTERKKITVTGVDEARLQPVTGNEPGAARNITGSQYADAGASRMTINGPQKVALTHTIAGRAVTGTEVGRAVNVTGDEYGSCRPVTGTEYVSSEQFQSICNTQAPPRSASKVGEDSSLKGQRITGNLVNRTDKVTGNEVTAMGRVTGSQYGDSQVAPRALPQQSYPMRALANRNQARSEQADEAAVAHVHHHRDGEEFCCDECAADHYARVAAAEARGMAPPAPVMCHGCADNAVAQAKQAAEGFSIQSPARAALGRITGNAYDTQGRITGSNNRGNQLISGTPEFRYQRPAMAVVAQEPAVAEAPQPAAASRITGDGRDSIRITGDDWGRSQRMTGTEGQWAQARNPTLRGMQQAMAMSNAHTNKGLEREVPPPAKVTGSSGNSGKGPVITVSGGARG